MFTSLLLSAYVFILTALVVAFYNCYYKRKGLPPGPTPIPFFGNSLTLMRRPPGEDLFLEWRQKYGNIFTFWLGETPIVCIAEYGKIVEHYQRGGESFAGRHAIEAYERIIRGGILGVLQTEGEVWREHRRFVLHVFRDFGVGKNVMQERILTEIMAMFKSIDMDMATAPAGQDLDIVRHFERAISSVINSLLVGFRFSEEHEEEYHRLNNQLWRFNNRMQNFFTNLFMWKPAMFKSFPPCRPSYQLVRDTHDIFFGFFDQQIQKHLQQLEKMASEEWDSSPPLDYMDAFIREKLRRDARDKGGDDEQTENHTYSFDQLKAVLFDLWISGQETTTTALAWGIALILHHPEVAKKVHAELDREIGDEHRAICWADRGALPYTNAVINEILRVGNVVAQDFPHRMIRDTPVDKWTLRQGQPIVAQISVVLMDPNIFADPKCFRPERFLDSEGNLRKSEELIPFALGKRQCLGESLARMELFLFFANIFNRYEILPGHQMPSLKREMGIPVLCPKFNCRMAKRQPRLTE